MCSLLDIFCIISEIRVSYFHQQCYLPHSMHPSVHQTNIIRWLTPLRNYHSFPTASHFTSQPASPSQVGYTFYLLSMLFPPFLQHTVCSARICTREPAAIRHFDRFLQNTGCLRKCALHPELNFSRRIQNNTGPHNTVRANH
jgi:hypothetical protein